MDDNLKAINIIHFGGKSIYLNDTCISHTIFKQGQVLEAAIYGNMIVIRPALSSETLKN